MKVNLQDNDYMTVNNQKADRVQEKWGEYRTVVHDTMELIPPNAEQMVIWEAEHTVTPYLKQRARKEAKKGCFPE